ncbi:unnamed protein product [Heterobilharzia americana]|nr:unnamed protein product [Heterobilharzia americana]
MDDKSCEAQRLQMTLADKGSVFSSDEIQDVLGVLREVPLKLIITNVPSEVFKYSIAQDSFEALFNAFDSQSKFVYLPSFQRVLIYMNRPEAALLARLQTQGWKLPEHIYASIPDSSKHKNDDGISCYIGNFGDSVDSDENDEDEEECDCCEILEGSVSDNDEYLEDNETEYFKENSDSQTASAGNSGLSYRDISEISSVHSLESTVSPSVPLQGVRSGGSFGSQKELTAGRTGSTSDFESTSEASGDPNTITPSSVSDGHVRRILCKHGKNKRRRVLSSMKHLAPPKPSRLFLLSPPSSPPVGWEPKPECEPVINYELLQALASLAPGETFELHPRDQENRHPSIVITPCETDSACNKSGTKLQIVQTRCPDRK